MKKLFIFEGKDKDKLYFFKLYPGPFNMGYIYLLISRNKDLRNGLIHLRNSDLKFDYVVQSGNCLDKYEKVRVERGMLYMKAYEKNNN